MISQKKVDRINQLAAKAKSEEGLTPEETLERESLRKEYIAAMRSNVKAQLNKVKFIEDLTPEERKKYEKNKKS